MRFFGLDFEDVVCFGGTEFGAWSDFNGLFDGFTFAFFDCSIRIADAFETRDVLCQ